MKKPVSEITEAEWAVIVEIKPIVRRRKLYPTFEGHLQALQLKTRKHKPIAEEIPEEDK